MKEIVAHKKLGAVQGLLLVLGLVAVLVVLNYFVIGFLAVHLGYAVSSAGFWILGCLLAWYVLRVFIVKYVYDMDDDVLRLSRKYGRRERYIEDIYLNRMLYIGSPEEAKKRYPQARRVNALHASSKEVKTAIVYQNSSGTRIALIQASPEMRAKLVEKLRRK